MRKAAGHSAKSSRLSTQRGASELLAGRERHAESSVVHHRATSSLLGQSTAVSICAKEAGALSLQHSLVKPHLTLLSCEPGLEIYVKGHTKPQVDSSCRCQFSPPGLLSNVDAQQKRFHFQRFLQCVSPTLLGITHELGGRSCMKIQYWSVKELLSGN